MGQVVKFKLSCWSRTPNKTTAWRWQVIKMLYKRTKYCYYVRYGILSIFCNLPPTTVLAVFRYLEGEVASSGLVAN